MGPALQYREDALRAYWKGNIVTDGQAALRETSRAQLTLLGNASEARAQAALKRFEDAIQSVLETPLDAKRVLEWTRLRIAAIR